MPIKGDKLAIIHPLTVYTEKMGISIPGLWLYLLALRFLNAVANNPRAFLLLTDMPQYFNQRWLQG